jgi:hypothetical protein
MNYYTKAFYKIYKLIVTTLLKVMRLFICFFVVLIALFLNSSCGDTRNMKVNIEKKVSIKPISLNSEDSTIFYYDTIDIENPQYIKIDIKSDIITLSNADGMYLIDTFYQYISHSIYFDSITNSYEIIVESEGDNNEWHWRYRKYKGSNKFQKIEGFEHFSFPQLIDTSLFIYHDFSPSGCDWEDFSSELFIVDSFTIKRIAYFSYLQCAYDFEQDTGFNFNFYVKENDKWKLDFQTTNINHPLPKLTQTGIGNNMEFWIKYYKRIIISNSIL